MNYVQFRKIYLLPIKWGWKKNRKAKQITPPTNRELLDKLEELNQDLSTYKTNEWQDGISFTEGRIDILNWIING